ncbi:MAG: HpcH/HpaI aldolase family protein [Spirochaetaceae bacterium]
MKNEKNIVRENKLLQAWNGKRHTLNGWLSIPNSNSAEVMSHAGWDSLTIDMQHGLIDYRDALSMLQAISTTDVVPLVRVPWLDEGFIMKMLDAGAYGIICPMVSTREQAQRFAKACRYSPRGTRSFGPIRASLYGGPGYADRANDLVISLAMIETVEAIENLEAILSVEELSGVYIGPSDLSMAHGFEPGFDREESMMLDIINTIFDKAASAGKYCGIHCATAAYAHRMIERGAHFVTIGSDMRFMASAAKKAVEEFNNAGS